MSSAAPFIRFSAYFISPQFPRVRHRSWLGWTQTDRPGNVLTSLITQLLPAGRILQTSQRGMLWASVLVPVRAQEGAEWCRLATFAYALPTPRNPFEYLIVVRDSTSLHDAMSHGPTTRSLEEGGVRIEKKKGKGGPCPSGCLTDCGPHPAAGGRTLRWKLAASDRCNCMRQRSPVTSRPLRTATDAPAAQLSW